MEWHQWNPIYQQIRDEFGYSQTQDENAAFLASTIIKSTITHNDLKRIIEGKIVSICGAAPTMEEALTELKGIIIAADDATSVLVAHGIIPNIITTDLDGDIQILRKAHNKGSVIVIHAHGDNCKALQTYAPLFLTRVMLTTQSVPFDNVYNFGGFTDGDRAYCLATHFHAAQVLLFGFDFDNPKEKKGKDSTIKKRKLQWARRIIEIQSKHL